MTNFEEFIACQICGVKMKSLITHIKRVHSEISLDAYKERHGAVEAPLTSFKKSQSAKRKYEKYPQLRETLRKVGSENIKKVNASGQGWKTPVGYFTDERRKQTSNFMKSRKVTWGVKIKENHWSRKEPDVVAEIVDKIVLKNKRYKRGKYTSTKTGNVERYHSSYEHVRMQELDQDENVLSWTKRHGIRITYRTHDQQQKNYVPDFLIKNGDGSVVLEEVKGRIIDILEHEAKVVAAHAFCEHEGMTYVVNFMEKLRRHVKS